MKHLSNRTKVKENYLISLFVLFSLAFSATVYAKIKLPEIVSSNMVLQRNTKITLWGWAHANEEITIKMSWIAEPVKLNADGDGNWRIEVNTTNSKDTQNINLKSKQSNITLDNILFGEVWLCSGQSNMERPVHIYQKEPVYATILAEADNPNLRLFQINKSGSKTLLNELKNYKGWEEASSKNIVSFSAVAYFFGKKLQETLDVPVGLIQSSYGASTIQSWINEETLSKYEEISIDEALFNKTPNKVPTVLFNAMINPIIPFAIKGTIWYQGEANRQEPEHYKKLLPAMVESWRSLWGAGEFPFYFVQIAPFTYGKNNTPFGDVKNTAFMREAMGECASLIPNSGMAVTLDVGNETNIHPIQKMEVADRLSRWALHKTYEFKDIDCFSPTFDTLNEFEGGLMLNFKGAENGLSSKEKSLSGFEIAGADKVFYPAKAEIKEGHKVYVKSEKVTKPVAVRYGWRNWTKGTLYDGSGLPASSFRTDDWNDATLVK